MILRAFFRLTYTRGAAEPEGRPWRSIRKLVSGWPLVLCSRPLSLAGRRRRRSRGTQRRSSAAKAAVDQGRGAGTDRARRLRRATVVGRAGSPMRASPSCASSRRGRPSARCTACTTPTDSLDLKSSVALVMDQDTNEVLFSKNSQAVLPIASLTKLMTAVVVTEASLPLDEMLTITEDDVDTEKGSRSRLRVGTS